MLGLPDSVRACLFDLDGVLTQTAKVHAAAWKEMFDAYLRERADRTGERFVAFDLHDDYDEYVDGKPRYDGVRAFLASRGLELSEGGSADPPSAEAAYHVRDYEGFTKLLKYSALTCLAVAFLVVLIIS